MDQKKLWQKISGSITFYFKHYETTLTNEELWLDYVECSLPDIQEDGVPMYLDKQSYEWVLVDDAMFEKAKVAFMERLEKRRLKEVPVPAKETKKVLAEVIDISTRR